MFIIKLKSPFLCSVGQKEKMAAKMCRRGLVTQMNNIGRKNMKDSERGWHKIGGL